MSVSKKPIVRILGTRGIPAAHGGFETFAERLALFLVDRGWHVVVYCQNDVPAVTQRYGTKTWRGVELVDVEVSSTGPKATLDFDWACVRHAGQRDGLCLVLGYNGAVFLPYLRMKGKTIITNMDGIEWRRPKWGPVAKTWFWLNEWIGAWVSHRLVADHPAIADHLATRRPRKAIATIAYGGTPILSETAEPVRALGLKPGAYLVSIARIEPDNNIHTIVEAFSRRRRNARLVVLGNVTPGVPYHDRLLAAASDEVVFAGAIYDQAVVQALRFHARAYVHGHTVGGTNPSLVEALAAGNAVIAHDNAYNRWTAGDAAVFFSDVASCDAAMTEVPANDILVERCRAAARARAAAAFDWTDILLAYEAEIAAYTGFPNIEEAPTTSRSAV